MGRQPGLYKRLSASHLRKAAHPLSAHVDRVGHESVVSVTARRRAR